jgi:hypothetical protein
VANKKSKVSDYKLYPKSLKLFFGSKLATRTPFRAFYISPMLPFVDLSSHYQKMCNFHVNTDWMISYLDAVASHHGNWWNFLMQFEGNQAKNGV